MAATCNTTGLHPFPTAVAVAVVVVAASRCPVTVKPPWCQVTAPLVTGEEEGVGVAASSYLQACCTGKLFSLAYLRHVSPTSLQYRVFFDVLIHAL